MTKAPKGAGSRVDRYGLGTVLPTMGASGPIVQRDDSDVKGGRGSEWKRSSAFSDSDWSEADAPALPARGIEVDEETFVAGLNEEALTGELGKLLSIDRTNSFDVQKKTLKPDEEYDTVKFKDIAFYGDPIWFSVGAKSATYPDVENPLTGEYVPRDDHRFVAFYLEDMDEPGYYALPASMFEVIEPDR